MADERGFTLIELMSAIFVTSFAIVALITTFDNSRGLISFSEQKETAVHAAEQELERLQALEWPQIALASAPPSPGADANALGYYVTDDADDWYRWDQDPAGLESRPAPRCSATGSPVTNCERLVVDGSGLVSPARQTITTPKADGGTRLEMQLQRFVTWVDGDCARATPGSAAPLCTPATSADFKRITVEVKILATNENRLNGGLRRPVTISTVVRAP